MLCICSDLPNLYSCKKGGRLATRSKCHSKEDNTELQNAWRFWMTCPMKSKSFPPMYSKMQQNTRFSWVTTQDCRVCGCKKEISNIIPQARPCKHQKSLFSAFLLPTKAKFVMPNWASIHLQLAFHVAVFHQLISCSDWWYCSFPFHISFYSKHTHGLIHMHFVN